MVIKGDLSRDPALPERANLQHLRKQAKARLAELRRVQPDAILADAQLQIARENGFSSWRALKAAFDRQAAEGDRAVGDWIGQPEGGVPVALRIRRENGRLQAQFDVPSLGYLGDPAEGLSATNERLTFQVTVRAVNAVYEGVWSAQNSEWRGIFTHDGHAMPLNFRRGVWRAPRIAGLDGLWDAQVDDAAYILRVTTDEKGTFAWLSNSLLPGKWFQAAQLDLAGSQVTAQWKTVTIRGQLHREEGRIEGRLSRQGRDVFARFTRRKPGAPAPGPTPA